MCLALAAIPAQASMLLWPNVPGWTAGAPAPGQTKNQSFTAVTPNDVIVSINNNGTNLTGAIWTAGYPAINNTLLTGGLSGTNALQLSVASQSSTTSYVEVTVTFANPVINLSFQLWDVDASSQFADTISHIQGVAVAGGTVAADSITSAVSGFNTITGSGLSTVVTGTSSASNTTNQGTIDITFSQQITQFSFRYSNSDSTLGSQGIGLGPLTFTVVPESADAISAALVPMAAVLLRCVRRPKRAKAA